MLYRNIRKIATGEWVDVLFTTEAASFNVLPDSHVADMAAALSLNANELEAIDAGADARTGTLLALPAPEDTGVRVDYAAASDDAARIAILARQAGLT